MCCGQSSPSLSSSAKKAIIVKKPLDEDNMKRIVRENQQTALVSHNELLSKLMPADLLNTPQSQIESKSREILEENARTFQAIKGQLIEMLVKSTEQTVPTPRKSRYRNLGSKRSVCCFEKCLRQTNHLSPIYWNDMTNQQRSKLIANIGLPKWSPNGQYFGCRTCRDLANKIMENADCGINPVIIQQNNEHKTPPESSFHGNDLEPCISVDPMLNPSAFHIRLSQQRSAFRVVKKGYRDAQSQHHHQIDRHKFHNSAHVTNQSIDPKPPQHYLSLPEFNCLYLQYYANREVQTEPKSSFDPQMFTQSLNEKQGFGISRRKRKSQPKRYPNHRNRWNEEFHNGNESAVTGFEKNSLLWRYLSVPPVIEPSAPRRIQNGSSVDSRELIRMMGLNGELDDRNDEIGIRMSGTIAMSILNDDPIDDQYYKDLNDRVTSRTKKAAQKETCEINSNWSQK